MTRSKVVKSIVVGMLCLTAGAVGVVVDDNLVVNGDFEAAGFKDAYKENCGDKYLIGWTCSGAGICMPKGTYLSTAIQAYDNTAWAFLKKISSISQKITFPQDGAYLLEFDFCCRPNHINDAQTLVTIDDMTVTNIVGAGRSANGAKVDHVVCELTGVKAGT